jgi:AcrR family transcriptional regulator
MPTTTSKSRLPPEEMRDRIVVVAEEHFRRIGYAKTAVADIAEAMGMSPANIYRFFPSKLAICDAICDREVEGIHERTKVILDGSGTASEKIRAILINNFRYNRDRCTNAHRLHDMVEVALSENWPAIRHHIETMRGFYAVAIREGISTGEFPARDAVLEGVIAQTATAAVCHPMLIAQCADDDLEMAAEGLAAFIIRALKAPKKEGEA